jgi:hypothetical protein
VLTLNYEIYIVKNKFETYSINKETYIFPYRMDPRTFYVLKNFIVSWAVTMHSTGICKY